MPFYHAHTKNEGGTYGRDVRLLHIAQFHDCEMLLRGNGYGCTIVTGFMKQRDFLIDFLLLGREMRRAGGQGFGIGPTSRIGSIRTSFQVIPQ